MKPSQIERAAAKIAAWRLAKTPISALPPEESPRTENDAYAIQAALHGRMTAAGAGDIAGYKIGCTTPVMQAYLNIRQPCAGGVFASTVSDGEAVLRADDYLKVGVECEIAVRLARPLSANTGFLNEDAIAEAVDSVMAAMEVVEDRYEDYPSLGIHPLIADDFFNAGAVLGKPVTHWRDVDLLRVRGSMRINGVEVGTGAGADVMGHPLNALAWLARRTAELGGTLPAGSFVLLGSVVQTHWLSAGDDVQCVIDGLGETALSIR